MKKRIILIIVLLAAICLAGWIIFKDYKSTDLPDNVADNNKIATSTPVKLAIPDLDRPIVVTANVSDAIAKQTTDGIKKVSAQLKQDYDTLDGWLVLGLYRRQIGDAEGARQAFEFLAVIRPKDSRAFNNLGSLYSNELKDFAKAESWYKKGIEANPQDGEIYSVLAEFYQYYTKQIDKVADVYLLGLKNNPGSLSMIYQLAHFYKDTGNRDQAIKYFQQVVALDPANASAKQSLEELKNN